MVTKKSIQTSEQSVKGWQLEATQKQVDLHETVIARIDAKLETILSVVQTRPTLEQVDDKITAASATLLAELKNSIEKQDLKYSPIVSSNKKLLWLLVATSIGLVGSLILFILGLVK